MVSATPGRSRKSTPQVSCGSSSRAIARADKRSRPNRLARPGEPRRVYRHVGHHVAQGDHRAWCTRRRRRRHAAQEQTMKKPVKRALLIVGIVVLLIVVVAGVGIAEMFVGLREVEDGREINGIRIVADGFSTMAVVPSGPGEV